MAFSIGRETAGTVEVLSLHGALDGHSAPQLEAALRASLARGHGRVLLNMGGLDYISSAGIGVLVEHMQRIQERNGALVLFSLSPPVWDILRLLNLQEVMPIAADRVTALAMAGSGAEGKPGT